MGEGPWQQGQRAWERLAGWYESRPWTARGNQDVGDGALNALSDIGVLRRLFDQVEFEAVRTARRQGKSWTEIAISLGVTRQSAWERWRDADESAGAAASKEAQRQRVVAQLAAGTAANRRRRSTVVVPIVIGMPWVEARRVLGEVGLVGVGPDPDGPPLAALGWPDGVVTDQSPESGAMVEPGAAVTLWVERGGGSGMREPRRPPPDPKTGGKMRDEASDEVSDEVSDDAAG